MGLRGSFWIGSGSEYCNCNYILKWCLENVAFPNAPNLWWSQLAESIAPVSPVIIGLMLDILRRFNLRLPLSLLVILLSPTFIGILLLLLRVLWLTLNSLIKVPSSLSFNTHGRIIRLLDCLLSITPVYLTWLLTLPCIVLLLVHLWTRVRILLLLVLIWLDVLIISSMILLDHFRDFIVSENGGKETWWNGSLQI